MSEQRRDEKDEKAEEKQDEKQDEKQEEKGGGEKWRRDPVSAVVWAAILIWAGLVLLLDNLGLLFTLGDLGAFSIGFIGAGAILALEAVFRVLVPAYRRPITGTLIFAAILVGIGLGPVIGWEVIGPLVLIVIGLSILLRYLIGQR